MAHALRHTWKAHTSALRVGAVCFLFFAGSLSMACRASGGGAIAQLPDNETIEETVASHTDAAESGGSQWLDPYPRRLGLTLSAEANMVANYIWRGQYVGGLSLQASARLNYEGVFVDMWWNVGATNWAFGGFNPEVDVAIGLDRWGLQLYWMQMHYFDGTGFFDLSNAAPGQAGNTSELRARYRISNRLPLSILWCTRLAGRDGYLQDGMLRRAFSSYLEIRYEWHLPYGLGLTTSVGMTPWKSLYTGFEGDFAVVNIDLQLAKQWALRHCAVTLAGNVMVNPWHMTKENIRWDASSPGQQRINANITVGVAWDRNWGRKL